MIDLKRIIDLFFGIISMLCLLPVFLIIMLAIKISSKGPLIFRQRRVAVRQKEFNIYKFRTMHTNTPGDVATHMLENPEKFITPVGKILRKTSLDELPQILNVIKGEMSFVGPRPALYNQYDLISQRERLGINKVQPGITGWAQINGRDELPISEKVKLDKYYVENMSLWFDFKIVLRTFFSVLMRKGIVEGSHKITKVI